MNKTVKIILIICIALAVLAFGAMHFYCSPATNTVAPVMVSDTVGASAFNRRMVDSAVAMVKSGYVVVRTGLGADSYLLAQMNLRDKVYSHCGMVMIENGYPFVYHSIGGEDNPDARIRRDSASFFFSPLHNFGFGIIRYDYPDSILDRLHQVVRTYYDEKRKFDMKFDLKTDNRLYCAELIYKAVNSAVGDSLYIKPSSAMGYSFIGIDDLYYNRHAKLIWQMKFK